MERRLEVIAQTFQGPLPPPEALRAYEEAHEGAAEWILDRAEKQGNHRQRIEKMIVNRGTLAELFGVFSAFGIGALAIGGGIFLIYNDKGGFGLAAIVSALGALVSVYRTGRKKQ